MRQQTFTMEMLAQAIDNALDKRGVAPVSSPSTFVRWYNNQRALDGEITLADLFDAVTWFAFGVGGGLATGVCWMAFGGGLDAVPRIVSGGGGLGILLGFGRVILDWANPLYLVRGFGEFYQAWSGGLWDEFLMWRNGEMERGAPDADRVTIEVMERTGRTSFQWTPAELPSTRQQLAAFAQGVLTDERSTSESEWAGGGKVFSVPKFRDFRDELIKVGLAQWNNSEAPAQGWALTARGRAVLRAYL